MTPRSQGYKRRASLFGPLFSILRSVHVTTTFSNLEKTRFRYIKYCRALILQETGVFYSFFLIFILLFSADLLFLESSEVVFRVAIKLLEIHQIELMKRDNFEDIMNYMKGPIPDIDASTMEKIMRDAFTMDVKKQMAEYQVEYNVLQEEICTAQHYMESLNREKENYTQLETKYQVNFNRALQAILAFLQFVSYFAFVFICSHPVGRIKYNKTRKVPNRSTKGNSSASVASSKFRNHRRYIGSIHAANAGSKN